MRRIDSIDRNVGQTLPSKATAMFEIDWKAFGGSESFPKTSEPVSRDLDVLLPTLVPEADGNEHAALTQI